MNLTTVMSGKVTEAGGGDSEGDGGTDGVVLAVQRREQRQDSAVHAFPSLIRAKPRRRYT